VTESENDPLVEAKVPPEQVVDLFSGLDELNLTHGQNVLLRETLIAIASDPEHPHVVHVKQPKKPEPPVTYHLGCLRCGRDLEPAWEGSRDAHAGTTFYADGNYGSTVFDRDFHASVDQLEVIICDICLTAVALESPHLVRGLKHVRYPVKPKVQVLPWEPREPE